MAKALLFISFACLILPGCSTIHQAHFPTPDERWKTHIGQLQYSNPQRSIIGEVTVRLYRNDFHLEVTKGPGLPLISVQETATFGRLEGGNKAWQGKIQYAPKQVRSWLLLQKVFSELSNQSLGDNLSFHSQEGCPWNAEATIIKNKLQTLKVEFYQTREKFIFYFNH